MSTVEQRNLGASRIVVPAMGIGIASWGERLVGYGRSHSRDDIAEAYRACLDAGLNFFDTAEGYGRGESERLLAECRRKDGRPIIVASKYAPASTFAPSPTRLSARALLKALDGSLQRLGVERIDLYQIHYPTAPRSVDALMDVLAEAVRAGKVLACGVSNYGASLLRRAHARLSGHGIALASNQVHYSVLHRYPETNGLLATCRELDISLIAYCPLEQGILTGKHRGGVSTITGPQRIFWQLLQLDPFGEARDSTPFLRRLFAKPRQLQRERLEPLFVALEEVAQTRGKTIAQVALNWLLAVDPRVIPIPGAKNVRQACENAGALGWQLTQEEQARVSQAEAASR